MGAQNISNLVWHVFISSASNPSECLLMVFVRYHRNKKQKQEEKTAERYRLKLMNNEILKLTFPSYTSNSWWLHVLVVSSVDQVRNLQIMTVSL